MIAMLMPPCYFMRKSFDRGRRSARVEAEVRETTGGLRMANVLILLRHPQKEDDIDGVYRGRHAKITEQGLRESQLIIEELVNYQIDAVMSSTIERAGLLGARIAKRLNRPLYLDPLLNELEKPEAFIDREYLNPDVQAFMLEWRERFDDDYVPEGVAAKSRSGLEEEMRELFAHVEAYPHERVVGVSHAKRIALIYHWVYRGERTLEGYYREADRSLLIENTEPIVFIRKPDRRTSEMHWHIGSTFSLMRQDQALLTEELVSALRQQP
jgi:broad specificity phosphatase PhoE